MIRALSFIEDRRGGLIQARHKGFSAVEDPSFKSPADLTISDLLLNVGMQIPTPDCSIDSAYWHGVDSCRCQASAAS